MLKVKGVRYLRLYLRQRGTSVLQGAFGTSLLLGCLVFSLRMHNEQQQIEVLQAVSARLTEQCDVLMRTSPTIPTEAVAGGNTLASDQTLVCWGDRLQALAAKLPEHSWLQTIHGGSQQLHIEGCIAHIAMLHQLAAQLRTLPDVQRVIIDEVSAKNAMDIAFVVTLRYQGSSCALG